MLVVAYLLLSCEMPNDFCFINAKNIHTYDVHFSIAKGIGSKIKIYTMYRSKIKITMPTGVRYTFADWEIMILYYGLFFLIRN